MSFPVRYVLNTSRFELQSVSMGNTVDHATPGVKEGLRHPEESISSDSFTLFVNNNFPKNLNLV
jgi:hypothetical protein